MQELDRDSPVVVDLHNGTTQTGRLRSADSAGLTLIDDGGSLTSIARADVLALSVESRRKSRGKGVLIGAAVGAGAGLALAYGVSEGIDVATRITMPILGAAGAGVGALTGYLVDRSRSRRTLVYTAP